MFNPDAQLWAVQNFKVILIAVIFLMGLFLALVIKRALQRKHAYKAFLREPLEDHLGDNLNLEKLKKAPSFDVNTYFAKEMMNYAKELGLNMLKKRDRYTKEGELTPIAEKMIAEQQSNMILAFTSNGVILNLNYADFIKDYRPYYTVGEFPKTIVEYMAFCTNPRAFQKVERKEEQKPDPLLSEDNEIKHSPLIEQTNAMDTYEEDIPVPEDDGIEYEDDAEPDVISFQTTATVDRDVILALTQYAEKLAKKTCDTKSILCEENGVKTEAYTNMCRDNYNKLSKIFFSNNCFKQEFADWANTEYPTYGVAKFTELIAPYLRYIKQK